MGEASNRLCKRRSACLRAVIFSIVTSTRCPALLKAGQDAPVQQDVQRFAVQGVVDTLAGPRQVAVPQRQQFAVQVVAHAVPEDLPRLASNSSCEAALNRLSVCWLTC